MALSFFSKGTGKNRKSIPIKKGSRKNSHKTVHVRGLDYHSPLGVEGAALYNTSRVAFDTVVGEMGIFEESLDNAKQIDFSKYPKAKEAVKHLSDAFTQLSKVGMNLKSLHDYFKSSELSDYNSKFHKDIAKMGVGKFFQLTMVEFHAACFDGYKGAEILEKINSEHRGSTTKTGVPLDNIIEDIHIALTEMEERMDMIRAVYREQRWKDYQIYKSHRRSSREDPLDIRIKLVEG